MNQPNEALRRLASMDQKQLCEIYDAVDCFEWHKLLGEKPEGFDRLPMCTSWIGKLFGVKSKHYYTYPVFLAITALVPEKELLRYYQIHALHRTEEEFEKWWNLEIIKKATGRVL